MPVKVEDVNGLDDVLSGVLKIAAQSPATRSLWYRGHPKPVYTLLPGLLRDGRPAPDVFERETQLMTRLRQRSLPYWPSGYF